MKRALSIDTLTDPISMSLPDTETSAAVAIGNDSARHNALPRLPLEPMDPLITSIQPGGGMCMRVELTWGHVRRWYLKTFRAAYVARMAQLRRGEKNVCSFKVLDSRDVNFYRNLGG